MKKLDDQYTFLARRLEHEKHYFKNLESSDILSSISVVDVSTTDLCNRTCVFCPRHDPSVYPNRNLRMTAEGSKTIAKRLQEINYSGAIAISGFGENLLNPELVEIVRNFREHNPKSFIECNTNGDPLKADKFKKLIDAGLNCLNINLYDGPEQVEKFNELLKDIPTDKYKYRAHWDSKDYGIIFNNRSGMIKWFGKVDLNENKNKPCYYPFYKLFVDWNGDVLFCSNDWGRVRVIGNLLQQSIMEVWMSKQMEKVRLRLADGNRNFKPCETCNVDGTLIGKPSFDFLMSHYNENSGNRKQ